MEGRDQMLDVEMLLQYYGLKFLQNKGLSEGPKEPKNEKKCLMTLTHIFNGFIDFIYVSTKN